MTRREFIDAALALIVAPGWPRQLASAPSPTCRAASWAAPAPRSRPSGSAGIT